MCGLYAHHALVQAGKDIDGGRGGPGLFGPFSGALPRAPRILGAVVGWGRMVMHTDGWRAQYARPVALAYDDWTPKMVEKLADLYGIPLVAREKLEQVAQEYGEKYEAAECLT